MARVTDPLFSKSASGRLGRDLLFRGGGSGTRVSRPPDPSRTNQGAPTAGQAAVRARYSAAAAQWRALDPDQREQWQFAAAADPRNLHGWALYLSLFTPLPPPPPPCDNDSYVPPDATLIEFPLLSCVADTAYIPPAVTAIIFP